MYTVAPSLEQPQPGSGPNTISFLRQQAQLHHTDFRLQKHGCLRNLPTGTFYSAPLTHPESPISIVHPSHVQSKCTGRFDTGKKHKRNPCGHILALPVHTIAWFRLRCSPYKAGRFSTAHPISFPFNGFTHCLTLFSKFFSSFPHGTCSLSVSCQYLALDEVYHPL